MPRPVRFDRAKVWAKILASIVEGDSLTTALRKLKPAPSTWWAKECLRRDPVLRQRYREAVEDRADYLAEQLIELADSPMPPGLDGPAKAAWVQQLRVRIDTRKWIASKLKPRTYGDRLDVSMASTQISITAALSEAQSRLSWVPEALLPSPVKN
jgi:hypothetical protein